MQKVWAAKQRTRFNVRENDFDDEDRRQAVVRCRPEDSLIPMGRKASYGREQHSRAPPSAVLASELAC